VDEKTHKAIEDAGFRVVKEEKGLIHVSQIVDGVMRAKAQELIDLEKLMLPTRFYVRSLRPPKKEQAWRVKERLKRERLCGNHQSTEFNSDESHA
jgi:hypothetical protein